MSQSKPPASPEPVVVRPSFRLVRPFYTISLILLAVVYGVNNNRPDPMEWLLVFPALLLLWTVSRHIRQRFSVIRIGGGKLRYETGMLSKNTRTMELSKIQDVRVEQSLVQRILNIGNLRIETAGETGGLSFANADRPQAIADYILEAAGRQK